jgi:hypothetical protein
MDTSKVGWNEHVSPLLPIESRPRPRKVKIKNVVFKPKKIRNENGFSFFGKKAVGLTSQAIRFPLN